MLPRSTFPATWWSTSPVCSPHTDDTSGRPGAPGCWGRFARRCRSARRHALPALYKAAAEGMPTWADKGYIGAGIGIRVPVRRPKGQSEQALHADTRATNALIGNVRALGERTAAELKQRWRTPQTEKTSLTGPFFVGLGTRAG
ncbi:transposase family protein [Streptomyces sp. NPDC002205]|uniref:transposase family protein n=1 Tax=Streptomyces sp. NPDC002205 TaxID=3154411 RepID=UPI0033275D9F